MLRLLVAIGLAVSLSFSLPLSLSCEAGTHTFTKVFLSSVKSLHNIFPIRIGNIKIGFSGEDYKSIGDNPVCICKDPFIRVGIKVSLWEPHALVEPVKIPWCTPSLPIPGGLTNSLSFNRFALGSDNLQHGNIELRSAQVHYYRFTPLSLLGLLLDFVCLEKSGFDLSYFTEVDPLWQDDRLASVVNPEAFLFANPLAQFACSVDAGASSVGFPLDALYWCMGSFGSFFPLSQNIQLDSVQASAGLSSRLLFKLHRELMLWGYVGEAGLCGRYPMPIMRKSQYNLQPLYPVFYPFRVPIGRTFWAGWGIGKEIPFVNRHNHVYLVYRKRDCCAF